MREFRSLFGEESTPKRWQRTETNLYGVLRAIECYGGAELVRGAVGRIVAHGQMDPAHLTKWVMPGGWIDRDQDDLIEQYKPEIVFIDGVFRLAKEFAHQHDAFQLEGVDAESTLMRLDALQAQVIAEFFDALTKGIPVQQDNGAVNMMIPTRWEGRRGGAHDWIALRIDHLLAERGFLRDDRTPEFQWFLLHLVSQEGVPLVYRPAPIPSPLRGGRHIMEAYAPDTLSEWEQLLTREEQARLAVAQLPLEAIDATASLTEQRLTRHRNDVLIRRLLTEGWINAFEMVGRTGEITVQLVPNGEWYLAAVPSASEP